MNIPKYSNYLYKLSGKRLSGKRLAGKVTVRETSVTPNKDITEIEGLRDVALSTNFETILAANGP